MYRWIAGLVFACIFGVSSAEAGGQRILLVYEGSYSVNQLQNHLGVNGYVAHVININYSTITPGLLSSYDQMWFLGTNPNYHRIIEQTEIEAIHSFQAKGGSLLLGFDHKQVPGEYCRYPGDYNQNLNLLANKFGISCAGCVFNPSTAYGPWSLFAPDTTEHEIWDEVGQIIAHDSECRIQITSSEIDVLGRMNNNLPVLAVRDPARNGCNGEGRILFDSSCSRYLDGMIGWGDQLRYIMNIATWLSTKPICNSAPVANAGADQQLEVESCLGAIVTLDGTKSTDPDGDSLSYRWTWSGGEADGPVATITLPLGIHEISLTVSDPGGLSSKDTAMVHVVDTTAPVLEVLTDRSILWPPNHKLVSVAVSTRVVDACVDSTEVKLLSVTSNEPDNGTGDGSTSGDIVISSPTTVLLRAERSGNGDGRIYTISYQAADAAGNTTVSSAQVLVPHHR